MLSQQELEAARKRYGLQPTSTQSDSSLSPRMQRLTQLAHQSRAEQDPRVQLSQKTEEEPGFFKSIVQSVASPFARIGTTAVAAADTAGTVTKAIYHKATGNEAAYQEDLKRGNEKVNKYDNQGVDLGYLGNTKAIKNAKEAVGVGADAASNFIGFEGAGALAKQGLKGAAIAAAKQGLKTGVAAGFLQGTGKALGEDKSVGESLKEGAISSAVGGAGGAVLGGVTGTVGYTVRKLGGLIKDFTTPEEVRAATRNLKDLKVLENSYAGIRKIVGKEGGKGIKVDELVSRTPLLSGSIDENGVIRTGNAIAELNKQLAPFEGTVRANLEKEGKGISIDKVAKILKTSVQNSDLEGEALDNALAKAGRELNGLRRRADKNGVISLAKIHDAKVFKYGNIDYLNPQNKAADKIIAKAFKTIVEKESSVPIGNINKELAPFYAVQNYLEALDGKRVQGGKLGKYFGRVAGQIAGSHFGPLGSIAGGEIGGKIAEKQMTSKFASKAGSEIPVGEALKGAAAKLKEPLMQLGGKVNDALNEVTPGLSTKAKYNITFPQNGKNATIKGIPKDELRGWLQYLESKGIKPLIKLAGTAAAAEAIAKNR